MLGIVLGVIFLWIILVVVLGLLRHTIRVSWWVFSVRSFPQFCQRAAVVALGAAALVWLLLWMQKADSGPKNSAAQDPSESASLENTSNPNTYAPLSNESSQADIIPLGIGTHYPRIEQVTARGLSAAPGAIVCSDFNTVSLVFDLYAEHWGEATQDAMTGGQSRMIRGDAIPAPNPPDYGCTLVPPGTEMTMQRVNGIPAVAVRMKDGTVVKGVTLGGMVEKL